MKRVLNGNVTVEQLEKELRRERHRRSYRSTLLSTISALVIVAAVAVLVSMLALPVLQVVGESMTPSLYQGEIVVAPRGTAFQKGDVIAFYYNNKILVKRVIANAGEWVNIDADGNVFINDVPLDEPYIQEKALGDCNITLPYQVPDGKIFVMGDHRATSSDSRTPAVGCVAQEQVVDIMKRLGDISSADSERMQRLALAYSQATQAGRLMGQDTLQFINAGFNPLYYISLRTGESMENLRDQMKKGKIDIQ